MTSTDGIKTYVLDTSVLLSSPRAIFSFAEHEVVLPIVVIKELEGKRDHPELGGQARTALRLLDELRVDQPKARTSGLFMIGTDGGTLRVEVNHSSSDRLPEALRRDSSNDSRILAVAKNLADEGADVTVVSKDLPMRFIASIVLGLKAEAYLHELADDDNYTGVVRRDVDKDVIDELYASGSIRTDPDDDELPPVNTGLVLTCAKNVVVARVTAAVGREPAIEMVKHEIEAFGVKGRSPEQKIALAHLLDPTIGIVSLGGKAGTGKSALALAAALEAVVERREQKRIVVFRPLFAVGGQELGYLPGSEDEKMGPWAAAVFDTLRGILVESLYKSIIEMGIIEVLPLTHIRGRTFTDTIMIVDEAQQLERPVLLTALSRTGNNSRVFLTHDVAQRDNLRVGRHDGIAAVAEALKGQDLFAHIELTKSERSPVAALVTSLLDDLDL